MEASGDLLRIAARTRDDAAAVCPGCGTESDWVHSRYVRHVADEAVGGRAVVIDLSVRRLYCENSDCPKTTFAEQVAGLTVRYQRRTPALQHVVNAVAVALAGSAGARLLAVLHCALSWVTVLNCLMHIPVPSAAVPRVLGIDEFALRRGHRYATIIIDAATGARVDVLADRAKEPVATWLRKNAGFEVVPGRGRQLRPGHHRTRHPTSCRSRTAGTCGTCSARRHTGKSWRTAPAGRPWDHRSARADARRPPASAGSRSMTCEIRAWACSNAPAA